MSARRSVLALVAALAVMVGPVVGSASADTTSDQAKLKQIATQLAQLDQQNSQLDDELLAAQQDAEQAKADVAATQAKIAEMQQRLGIVQEHVSELALQTFSSGDSSGGLGALLGDPSKLTSTVERDQYTKLAFSDGQDSIDELGAGVDELNKEQAKLVRQQQTAEKKSTLVSSKQADLNDKTAALQTLKADTEAQYGKDQVAEAEAAQQQALQQSQAAKARALATKADSSGGNGVAANSSGNSGGTPKRTAPASGSSNGDGSTSTAAPAKGSSSGSSGGSPSGGGHAAPPPSPGAAGAVAAAVSQIGVPYQYAMAVPNVGFDCSGLTSWAWGQAGKSIPHQSAQQYASLPHVPQSDVQPGDLLFFYSPISHVAMYAGGGQFIDAPNTGQTVRTGAVNWGSVVGIARP